jgi:hypothetical protein
MAVALVFASAAIGAAQDIAGRVKQVGNGTVRLMFASKPGVCGDGESFISTSGWNDDGDRTTFRESRKGGITIGRGSSDNWRDCEEGPLRVELEVDDGQVVDLHTYVGKNWSAGQPVMQVSSKAAVNYLLGLVEHNNSRVGKRAMTPIIMADSVEPWRDLLRIARNDRVAHETRKSAVFWVSQAAGEEATRGLKDMVGNPGDIEVRKSAIFALSQQRNDAAVTALIDVAKKNPEKELRKSAIFWLGQIDDPRVLAMFEEILLKQ